MVTTQFVIAKAKKLINKLSCGGKSPQTYYYKLIIVRCFVASARESMIKIWHRHMFACEGFCNLIKKSKNCWEIEQVYFDRPAEVFKYEYYKGDVYLHKN